MVFTKILNAIQQHDTIIIHRHVNADPDALGSQLGLAQLIKDNFNKPVYCVGQDAETLAFIGQMDHVLDSVYDQSLVIVVDTANRPRIDDARYTLGKTLVKIDHHPEVDSYGDISYVDTSASSASEIIADFAKDQQLTVSDTTARLLYTGIIGDTGRFLYSNTTQKTMAVATYLRGFAFSPTEISQAMQTISLAQVKLLAYVYQHLTISESGVAHVVLTQDVLQAYQLKDEHTASVVSLPGSIEGVLAWVTIVEQKDGTYRCRIRSKGPVINELAQQFDGGGHPKASGATAKTRDEVNQLLAQLNVLVDRYQQEGH